MNSSHKAIKGTFVNWTCFENLPIKQENLGNQYCFIIITYIRKEKLIYKKQNKFNFN